MARVLIIGSGGREHAFGWKLAQSQHVDEIFFSPGNGGTSHGKMKNIPLDGTKKQHFPEIQQWCKQHHIDLVVVGPEAPLVEGLVDFLQQHGIRAFGPSAQASRLEEDKFYSFDLMDHLALPQAKGRCCRNPQEAITAIRELSNPQGIVLKARGLTAGKGVKVCNSPEEAIDELQQHAERYGSDILVSERLVGEEYSVFALCDGKNVMPFPTSFQDHKRAFDGDQGPNTGGMGAYGPAPIAPPATVEHIIQTIVKPVVQELHRRGTPFHGFLYAGMMQTQEGPKVLEFNVRFGDPECQAAMMLLAEDLYPLLLQASDGTLPEKRELQCHKGSSCCVVIASMGYPGEFSKGHTISITPTIPMDETRMLFHAGTTTQDGTLRTSGGRLFGLTAYAESGIEQAIQQAYRYIPSIQIEGGFHHRKDIGHKAIR